MIINEKRREIYKWSVLLQRSERCEWASLWVAQLDVFEKNSENADGTLHAIDRLNVLI